MTTFTTEDRILAEKDGSLTVNVNAGEVTASPPHIVDSGASVMKDKPIAYINVEERKLEWAEPITWHTPTIAQMEKIPLYTHPAKTLTDEEILELADKHLIAKTKDIGMGDCIAVTEGEIDFARAILKKARE